MNRSNAERINQQLAMADTTDEDQTTPDLPALHVGDHVTDREDDDNPPLVVVKLPTENASDYDVNGQSIADYNPDYPPTDDVIEVAYAQRTDVALETQNAYGFPRSRLRLVTPLHDRQQDGGGSDD